MGLRAEARAMLVSHIISYFSLYYPAFMLGQFIQHLGLSHPFYSLGILSPFHSLGILGPVTTSFAFGFIGLRTNPVY